MNTQIIRKQAQAGFTLIELIVVIVILGILAATALPRMFDMSGQARIAKMQATLGAMRAASSTAHAAWLVGGGVTGCTKCGIGAIAVDATEVNADGKKIKTLGGYPEVGNDGATNSAKDAAGGIVDAIDLSPDFVLSTRGPADTDVASTNNNLSIAADEAHPNCRITYTEATVTGGTDGTATAAGTHPRVDKLPVITGDLLTVDNCG